MITTRRIHVALLFALTGINGAVNAAEYALERNEMRAQLTPHRYTTLSAEMGAKVKRLPFKEGERFAQGALLIEFDCALQAAQLDKARAQLDMATNTWQGNERLSALNAVGQVELQNSKAEVNKAKADVALLQTTLEKCRVQAPFQGRIAEQKAREEQFVQPGQALLDILDDSRLELEFILPSKWLTWIKPGHAFKVRIDETGKNYPAKLLRLGARADPVSQTIKAVAVIDGSYPELIAGMSGQILLSPASR